MDDNLKQSSMENLKEDNRVTYRSENYILKSKKPKPESKTKVDQVYVKQESPKTSEPVEPPKAVQTENHLIERRYKVVDKHYRRPTTRCIILSVILKCCLLSGLIIGAVFLYLAFRPALYLESCLNRPCSGNLKCLNGTCNCYSTEFYNLQCYDKKTYKEKCTTDLGCFETQNLFCVNGVCNCTGLNEWNGFNSCDYIVNRTYTEQCYYTNNCILSAFLICSNFQCLCNSTSFWNGTSCYPKLPVYTPCTSGVQCQSAFLCTNNICSCPSGTYWKSTVGACVVYSTYTESCLSTSECKTNLGLICNGGSNNCSCPTALSNGKCDCYRTFGNESYWDSTICVTALAYGKSCSGSGGTYMCQKLTQGTICNSSTGIFQCECPPLKYFNGISCVNQLLNGQSCPLGIECRTDYGLTCQSGTCLCNSASQFWSTSVSPNKCINYRTYTQSCSSTSECDTSLGLICHSGTDTDCNCPSNSVNGFCDCRRENNTEYYWNNVQCVSAATYLSSCTVGKNYMCQTITQNTTCIASKCDCGSSGGFSVSSNQCIYCDVGWTFIYDECFRVGPFTTVNTDSNGIGSKVDTGCDRSDTMTAKITNSTILNFFMSKQTTPNEYWVDGYRTGGMNYRTRDFTELITGPWCSSYPDGKNMVYWSSSGSCLKTADNTASITLNYFCQYKP